MTQDDLSIQRCGGMSAADHAVELRLLLLAGFPSCARRGVRRQHPTGMTREHARLERGDFDCSNGVGWYSDFRRRRLQASHQLRFFWERRGKDPSITVLNH